MKILITGSGAREHALAWKIAQSDLCTELFVTPGNAGIAQIATCLSFGAMEFDKIKDFCVTNQIDFVVVASDDPLVGGLVDVLEDAGIAAFGPSKAAARLEGSKGFTKDICKKYHIPTAAYESFSDVAAAKTYANTQAHPLVIKADGLAAGKGVIIAQDVQESHAAIESMLSGQAFGASGASIVIEEFLSGEEVSYFVLCDGEHALPLASAQDHKRAFDGDQGPNTGGMGAYSPAPILTKALEQETLEKIIMPTLKAMQDLGCPFKGILYAGLMLTAQGPKLIEYNVRFGDPECQVILPRLENDLVSLMLLARRGELDDTQIKLNDRHALTVIYAAKGYPENPLKNTEIKNLPADNRDLLIFQASTKQVDGKLLAGGGRALAVTGLGKDLTAAKDKAYEAIQEINWPDGFYRQDIGHHALKKKALDQ